MKIYTRTGDAGETGLYGGRRVAKDSVRVIAYGTVDELNAELGLARAALQDAELDGRMKDLQVVLFVLGAELATDPERKKATEPGVNLIVEEDVEKLEREIDAMEAELEPMRHFILPGGSSAGALIHRARTVCRRAERDALILSRHERVRPEVLRFLNRLSDHLFVLARHVNQRAGSPETPWIPR